MVINSNIAALRASNILQRNSEKLEDNLQKLSSGSKITKASDDAAGLAVSSRLDFEIKSIDTVNNNLANAQNFVQTQDANLKVIESVTRRMGELATLAFDSTKSDADRQLYQNEFQQLQQSLISVANSKFNNINLFSADSLDVTVNTSETTKFEGIDLIPNYKSAGFAKINSIKLVTSGENLINSTDIVSEQAINLKTPLANNLKSGDVISFDNFDLELTKEHNIGDNEITGIVKDSKILHSVNGDYEIADIVLTDNVNKAPKVVLKENIQEKIEIKNNYNINSFTITNSEIIGDTKTATLQISTLTDGLNIGDRIILDNGNFVTVNKAATQGDDVLEIAFDNDDDLINLASANVIQSIELPNDTFLNAAHLKDSALKIGNGYITLTENYVPGQNALVGIVEESIAVDDVIQNDRFDIEELEFTLNKGDEIIFVNANGTESIFKVTEDIAIGSDKIIGFINSGEPLTSGQQTKAAEFQWEIDSTTNLNIGEQFLTADGEKIYVTKIINDNTFEGYSSTDLSENTILQKDQQINITGELANDYSKGDIIQYSGGQSIKLTSDFQSGHSGFLQGIIENKNFLSNETSTKLFTDANSEFTGHLKLKGDGTTEYNLFIDEPLSESVLVGQVLYTKNGAEIEITSLGSKGSNYITGKISNSDFLLDDDATTYYNSYNIDTGEPIVLDTDTDYFSSSEIQSISIRKLGRDVEIGDVIQFENGAYITITQQALKESTELKGIVSGASITDASIGELKASSLHNIMLNKIGINTREGASALLQIVKNAKDSVAGYRASIGAVQSRISYSVEQMSNLKESLSKSVSQITDANMADLATEFSRLQILQQSGVTMLATANQSPNNILRLLQ